MGWMLSFPDSSCSGYCFRLHWEGADLLSFPFALADLSRCIGLGSGLIQWTAPYLAGLSWLRFVHGDGGLERVSLWMDSSIDAELCFAFCSALMVDVVLLSCFCCS